METNKYENKLADSVDCCYIQVFTPWSDWSVFAVWEVTSSVNISCCCLCRLFPTNSSRLLFGSGWENKWFCRHGFQRHEEKKINQRTEKRCCCSIIRSIDVNQLSCCSTLVKTAATCAILQSVIPVNLIQPWNPQSQTQCVSQFGEISPSANRARVSKVTDIISNSLTFGCHDEKQQQKQLNQLKNKLAS